MNENVVRPSSAEPILSTYLNTRGVQLGLPVSGTFELTARCNFSCRMCYVHLQDAQSLLPRELTADQWLSMASDARDMGMMFLLLTGGEPFLRQDFPEIYRELIKMGLVISINTNASLYGPELDALFRQYPPSRINVTLYGGSEETYSSLCGSASYEKVVKNLRTMKEAGLPVRLNVSLTPYNCGDMGEIDRISRELGLQAKAASYMYPPVRVDGSIGQNAARFSPQEAGAVMARWNALRDTGEMFQTRAQRIRDNMEESGMASCQDAEQEGVLCRAGRSSFWLTWDGRMLPCGTMDAEPAWPLKTGFRQAWEDVRKLSAEIRLPRECAVCPERKLCGVCAAICKCETGKFDGKPEYMCQMARSLRETTLAIADERNG